MSGGLFYVGDNMLVIHPDECIDCGVCEPECPAEAIVPDSDAQASAWAGAQPYLCGAMAEHHPQGRAAGRRRRMEGRAGQVQALLLAGTRKEGNERGVADAAERHVLVR